jgi:drug/metabolite transporter (DMT)-like permease
VNPIRETEITRSGSDWRTPVAVTITVFAWASAFVVIRYAAHDIDPGALSLGRLLVASLALSVMMIGRKLVRMTSREWALTALVGVAWFAVYSVALNAGEQTVDAGTAAMLIQLAPILIGILAGFLLGEGFHGCSSLAAWSRSRARYSSVSPRALGRPTSPAFSWCC